MGAIKLIKNRIRDIKDRIKTDMEIKTENVDYEMLIELRTEIDLYKQEIKFLNKLLSTLKDV